MAGPRSDITLERICQVCERFFAQDGFVQWSRVGAALGVSRQAIQLRLRAAVEKGQLTPETIGRWQSASSRAAASREREAERREAGNERRRRTVQTLLTTENAVWLREEAALRGCTTADIINGLLNRERTQGRGLGGVRGVTEATEIMKHPELDMVYVTPSEVLVHVLKEYHKRRDFCPENRTKSIALANSNIECIQNLASGLTASFEEYEQKKDQIASWLKEEIPRSFHPRFVVAPPSQRKVAGDLASSLAKAYGCMDLSGLFSKQDYLLRSGKQEVALEALVKNLNCSSDLEFIRDGDSILIVDDVLSTGLSIDSMKTKIIGLSNARGLLFTGAAVLKV